MTSIDPKVPDPMWTRLNAEATTTELMALMAHVSRLYSSELVTAVHDEAAASAELTGSNC